MVQAGRGGRVPFAPVPEGPAVAGVVHGCSRRHAPLARSQESSAMCSAEQEQCGDHHEANQTAEEIHNIQTVILDRAARNR